MTFYKSYLSKSEKETEEIGCNFTSNLARGDIIALIGDLGVGKTALTRGIAQGIGSDFDIMVSSPSYTIISEYATKIPLFHLDLFRLEGDDLFDLGLEEYFVDYAITVIEWADRMIDLSFIHWIVTIKWIEEEQRSIEIVRQKV